MIQSYEVGPYRGRMWIGGDGPPLLYLHGFEQHPGEAPFLTALAERHQVIAPEHPGYGESVGGDPADGPGELVLCYQGLLAQLGIGEADVVGHCLGGMFAAELAARCPTLVRRLVLISAYGLWLDDVPAPDPFFLSSTELAAAKWHDPSRAKELDASTFAPQSGGPGEAIVVRVRNLATATRFLSPLPDRGLVRRLPFVKAPTLVVHGDSDGLVPLEYAKALTGLIPGARLARLSEAGHLAMVELPAELDDLLAEFLPVIPAA